MGSPLPYLGFLSVSLLIAASPGPSWVYTISTTLRQGRRAGMAGNLGNSTGILCHALATGFGLSMLLEYSAGSFHLLKFLGVFYLCYLAWRNFHGSSVLAAEAGAMPLLTAHRIFCNGIFVSLFNPKIFLLMVALLPQFIAPGSPTAQRQLVFMGATHALVAGLVHTFLIFSSHQIACRLKGSATVQKWLRWVTGTLFLIFGTRLALVRQFP